MKLGSVLPALALLLGTCGQSTGPANGPLPEGELAVRVGEEATIPGTVLRLGVARVSGDSRCPIGVVCVWEGDAAVEIALTAGTGPTEQHELHTTLDPRFVDFAGVRVTLVDLVPYPREGQAIAPDSYVAGFDVEALTP